MDDFGNFKEPTLSLRDIGDLVRRTDSFTVCGPPEPGINVRQMIEKVGKRVSRFVELKGPGLLSPDEIRELKRAALAHDKVIVASYHEMEIAGQLREACRLAYYRDYLFFDHVQMALDGIHLDSFGRIFYDFLQEYKEEFTRAFALLEDSYSRETYEKVIRMRVYLFNPELIPLSSLPTPPEVQWRYESEAAMYLHQIPSVVPEPLRRNIAFKISLNPCGYFDIVTPRNKSVIIDIGAYNNTSPMFAYYSPHGTIYAFEPQDEIYRCNVELAKVYPNIRPIKAGAWSVTGSVAFDIRDCLLGGTAGSHVSAQGTSKIEVCALDDFVSRHNVGPVDFIKIDAEGAEIEVLKGARDTIARYKPDLAVSLYHEPEHLFRIPFLIKELYDGYKIYVSHKYFNATETTCFASA